MSKPPKNVGRVLTRQATPAHGGVGLRPSVVSLSNQEAALVPGWGNPICGGMAGEWREATLQDAFEINPRREIKRGMVTPFVPMDALPEHAREIARIDAREFTGSGTRFKNGDTLLARITPCLENGKTAYVSGLEGDTVAHGSTEYIVIAEKQNVSDGLFAYYLARSSEFRSFAIGHMEGTSGRQRVPTTAVAKFQFRLPPLPEQKTIAHILGTLDDKIELNRRMNATLEAVARALFQSWFVDFDPVRTKLDGRQPAGLDTATAALFPAHFQESPLGHTPKGWEVRSLDQVAHFLNGLALQKYPPGDGVTLPVIKIAQLRKGNSEGADRCNTELAPQYIVEDGDVLFSWSGSLEVELWCGGQGALNQHLFKVTSPEFPKWFYYLWALYHLDEFRLIAAGKATTMGHIQRGHLTAAKVLVPPSALLDSMTRIMAPLIDQIIANRTQSRTLATIRDALLPKLLSGALSVVQAASELETVI